MRRSEAVAGVAAPAGHDAPAAEGIVVLDKPAGLSSNAALQRVRALFGRVKAGHTGSLDPLASGMLPICLGRATRLTGYLLDASKAYRVVGRFGARTATGDAEGEKVETCGWDHVDEVSLREALETFRGRISQIPPMYSALKQGGERLYRKARRGETVERAPRPVEIRRLDLLSFEPPEFELDVECSKGTYVRTLVEDVAAAVGSCAHVTALRRYGAGPFTEGQMHSLEELEALAARGAGELASVLLPADAALEALPAVALPAEDARRILTGQPVHAQAPEDGAGLVRIYGPAGFLGVGSRAAEGLVAPKRLMGAQGGS